MPSAAKRGNPRHPDKLFNGVAGHRVRAKYFSSSFPRRGEVRNATLLYAGYLYTPTNPTLRRRNREAKRLDTSGANRRQGFGAVQDVTSLGFFFMSEGLVLQRHLLPNYEGEMGVMAT